MADSSERSERAKKVVEAALLIGLAGAAMKTVQYVRNNDQIGNIYFFQQTKSVWVECRNQATDKMMRLSASISSFNDKTGEFDGLVINEPIKVADEELEIFEAAYPQQAEDEAAESRE